MSQRIAEALYECLCRADLLHLLADYPHSQLVDKAARLNYDGPELAQAA